MSTVNRARRAVMRTAERHGFDERLKQLRGLTNAGLRRDLRDHHAIKLILGVRLRADSHTIDVGAHEGSVLRDLVALAPDGRHLAFEPIPEMRARLDAEFGPAPNVEVRGAALSDENGEAVFHHVTTAPGYSGLKQRDMPAGEEVQTIRVPTERMDDVLPEDFAPDLIKIDVEGAEMLVLRGGAETIARHRPTIVFEHGAGGFEQYGYGPGDLHDLLVRDCGLRIFDLAGVGPYSRQRFEQVFDEPIWNFVAG
jgi:FkbM family methyltransferase